MTTLTDIGALKEAQAGTGISESIYRIAGAGYTKGLYWDVMMGRLLVPANVSRLTARGRMLAEFSAYAPSFYAELSHTAVPTIAATGTTATFTRATTKTIENNDGYLVTLLAGEIGFPGARRVRNLISTTSEDFSNAAWVKQTFGTGVAPVVTGGFTDPDGGSSAYRVQLDHGGGVNAYSQISNALVASTNGPRSIWIKSNTGATQTLYLVYGAATAHSYPVQATTSWTRVSAGNGTGTAYSVFDISTDNGAGTASDQVIDVLVWRAQCEDVTAQTTQTAGEYVSVGVPSDWAGDELVTNGTFDSTTTGWTSVNSPTTFAVSSGQLRVVAAAGQAGYGYQAFSTVIGQKYVVSLGVTNTAGANGYRVGTTTIGGELINGYPVATGSHTATFTATTTTTYIATVTQDTVGQGLFDNISVKPAYYHGSFVDGVKCFPTDLAGNALPTAYTYDAVSLNGVAGTYVSTPDSVANSITGDIDIRVKVNLPDASPTPAAMLAAKYAVAGTNKNWALYLTNALVQFTYSVDGSAIVSINSTTPYPPTLNGVLCWLRCVHDVDNGSAGNTVTYYYSTDDQASWVQLGDPVVTAGAVTRYDNTAPLEIGGYDSGAEPLSGHIYQAQIYNGINGTLAVDFDASRYAGGTTLTGSTGETWTLNGSAVIHPTNNPMLGYLAEGARTNLCLQSNTFGAAPWGDFSGTMSKSQNATGPDGVGNSAWTLTDDSAAGEAWTQTIALANATEYCCSVFIKKTSGALTSYPAFTAYNAGRSVGVCVNTTAGTATAITAYQGATIGTTSNIVVQNFNTDYWRVSFSFTTNAAANWLPTMHPAFNANGTGAESLSATGSAVFYGAQVELGSFASSYIATTTAAVTRDADVLTYSSAGNIDGTKGWCYAGVVDTPNTASLRQPIIATYPSGNGLVFNTYTATSPAAVEFYDGTAFRTGQTYTQITDTRKFAASWGTGCRTAVDGSVTALLTFDGDAAVGTVFSVGNYTDGSNGGFRNIGPIYIGQRQLSASELQAITT